jgi:type I restriction enzyme M protein
MADTNGSHVSLVDFIWKNAEDLWGDFKHTDFGKVILPFTLLRRLECVLEPTRKPVREAYLLHKDSGLDLGAFSRNADEGFRARRPWSVGPLPGPFDTERQ